MDEKLLEEIARLTREDDDAVDERWRRLAAGTLDPEEEEALRAEARKTPEGELDLAAFEPLGADFHDRVVDALRGDAPRATAAVPDKVAPGRVVPFVRRPAFRRILALAAVLAAAVLGLRLLRGPGDATPLSGFTAELEGQRKDVRGETQDAAVPVFEDGGPFRLVLRPAAEARGLDFALFLAPRGGEPEPWDVGYSVSAGGVVKVEGTLGRDLDLGPGDWTVLYVYGLPGQLPDAADLAAGAAPEAGRWDVVRVDFRVAADPVAGDGLSLGVLFAGCAEVSPGPTCVPYPELTLWLRSAPEARLEVRVGGRLVDDPGTDVDGGRQLVLAVSPGDGDVEVTASLAGREARWRLGLAGSDEPRWLYDARLLAWEGDAAAAREALSARLDDAPPAARAAASSLLARLGVEKDEAVTLLEEAVRLHREDGRLLAFAEDVGMLLGFDVEARRFGRVRQRLDAAVLPAEAPGEARFHLAFYRAVLESGLGHFRAALDALDDATALARRLGLGRERTIAEEKTARVLARLGREDEALALYRRLDVAVLEPCDRARFLGNHAWRRILAADPGGAAPLLASALGIVAEASCGDALELDLWLDQALAMTESGRLFEAHAALAEADERGDAASTLHRLWWEDVRGRLALAGGDGPAAVDHYRRMSDLAADAYDPEGRWWAKLGEARARVRLGDVSAALAALDEAETLLDEKSLAVPVDAGRESLAALYDDGARLHLELLLDAGRDAQALDVARRSRARALRTLRRGHRLAHLGDSEQALWDHEVERYLELRGELEDEASGDWRLTGTERAAARERRAEKESAARRALDRAFSLVAGEPTALPPLRDGELVLAWHPLSDGWVGFAAGPAGVAVHRFELGAGVLERPDELARRLLEPFHEAIVDAERVRVLPYGELREVDVHALPFAGGVLLEAVPVVYGLDVGRPRESPRGPADRRALVVADPRGDLPAARREGEVVEEALLGAAWDVRRLDAAVPAELRRRLGAGVGLLHFAGHGVAGGRFGWESALELADGTRFTLGDVLALERAPSRVVLSSCDSARAAASPVLSLGLAQAFLVAGAERVVASVRPVGDRDTEALFRRLYAAWDDDADLALLVRAAQLAWRDADPAADWASFRVLEP